jgi:hypothetical protein
MMRRLKKEPSMAVRKRANTTNPVGRPPKYPWATMRIGDTFVIRDRSIISVWPHCWSSGRVLGRKFRAVEAERGGVVVMRVK